MASTLDAGQPSLDTRILVGHDGEHVWFVADAGWQVRYRPRDSPSAALFEHVARDGIGALLDWGTHGTRLHEELAARGALEAPGSPQTAHVAGIATRPLASVLASGVPEPLARHLLVLTASEALFLPAAIDRRAAADALRLFVAGLRPEGRLRCYAHAVRTRSRTAIGDRPLHDALAPLLDAVHRQRTDVPTVSDLGTRAAARLGELPGRLHVVQSLMTHRGTLERRPIHQVRSSYAVPDLHGLDGFQHPPRATGTHFRRALAQTKAVSESLERFAAGDVTSARLVKSSARSLADRFLDPRTVMAFLPEQYARHEQLVAFEPDDQVHWVRGVTGGGEECWVIADLVFYPFHRLAGLDRVIAPATPSGVACRPASREAKTAALRELVERDAFMATWLGRRCPPRILDRPDGEHGELIRTIERAGWTVLLLDISRGHGTCVMAVAMRPDAIFVGAGCGSPRAAAEVALRELTPCLASYPESSIRPERVRSPQDHRDLYRQAEFVREAEFLTASATRVRLDDLADGLSEEVASRAVYVELPTPPGTRVSVWRCVCPGLIPITYGWDLEPRGLQDVLSLAPASPYPLTPHPFA